MFFGGDRSRSVNLGGKGGPPGKNVVDAAKRAREEREKQRQRELATLKIQAVGRSFLALRRARNAIQADWCLNSVQAAPSAELLLQGVREFNFFNVPSKQLSVEHAAALSHLIKLVCKSILSPEPSLNLVTMAQRNTFQWIVQMRKLLLALQRRLRAIAESRYNGGEPDLAVQMLSYFTSPNNIDKFSPPSTLIGATTCRHIITFLIKNMFLDDICAVLQVVSGAQFSSGRSSSSSSMSSQKIMQPFSAQELFKLPASFMLRLSESYPFAPVCIHLDDIFSALAPVLRQACAISLANAPLNAKEITTVQSSQRYAQTLRHVARVVSSNPAEFGADAVPPLFNAIATLVDQIEAVTSKQETRLLLEIEELEKGAQVHIPSTASRRSVSHRYRRNVHIHEEDVDLPQTDGEIDDTMEGVESTSLPTDVADQVQTRALELSEIESIHTIIRNSILKQLYSPDVMRVLCSRLNQQPEISHDVLMALSQLVRIGKHYVDDQSFMEQIYEIIAPVVLPTWHSIIKPALQQASSSWEDRPMKHLIGLFCRGYAYMLQSSVSDDDFYVLGTPFATKDIVEMILLLRKIPIQRISNTALTLASAEVLAEWDSLLSDIHELWLQLFRRQWKRSYTSYQNFFMMNLSANDIINSATGPDKHPIVRKCPLLIPTAEKVKLLHYWIEKDKVIHQPSPIMAAAFDEFEGEMVPSPVLQQIKVKIRRSHIVEDAIFQLGQGGKSLKQKVKVEFIRDDGEPEPGVDGGGLFRELFTEVIGAGISPSFGLFTSSPEHTLIPNPNSASVAGSDHLQLFEIFGRFVGKSVYERLLLDLPLAQSFISTLLSRKVHLSDLIYFDSQLHSNLFKLTTLSDEELSDFYFVTTSSSEPTRTIELVPGGAETHLSRANVWQYVRAVAQYKLLQQSRDQINAFVRGFREVIPLEWCRIFSEDEFLVNITGTSGRIDLNDLQQNCEYSGGYHETNNTILLLWEVLNEMTDEEHEKFLKFVTSHSRPPILGFKTLEPKFAIKRVDGTDRLPSANTCMNLFKLPPYQTKAQLKEKLLYAINAGAGFELS